MISSTYPDDSDSLIADYWTAPQRLVDSPASDLTVWLIILDLFAAPTLLLRKGQNALHRTRAE